MLNVIACALVALVTGTACGKSEAAPAVGPNGETQAELDEFRRLVDLRHSAPHEAVNEMEKLAAATCACPDPACAASKLEDVEALRSWYREIQDNELRWKVYDAGDAARRCVVAKGGGLPPAAE